jgi:3-isopropylmalate dehydrogenase
MKTYEIAVIHGDGIGPEVCRATIDVVEAALGNYRALNFIEYPAGAEHYRRTAMHFYNRPTKAARAAAIMHG